MGVLVATGICYLDSFVGDQESDKYWLAEEVEGWMHFVKVLDGVERWHLQTAYAGLHNFLQQNWVFVPGGGGNGEILTPGPFQGRHRRNPVKRDHPPACQAGGFENYKLNSLCLG